MKRVWMVGIMLVAVCVAPALAADDGATPWSGWYAGLGLSSSSGEWNISGSADGSDILHDADGKGGFWNASFGYNFRVGGSFVLGLEASYMGTDLEGTAAPAWSYAPGVPDGSALSTYRMPRIASVVGRVGFLASPTMMVHADIGVAQGNVYHDWVDINSLSEGEFGAASSSASGTVVGLGVAWSITPRWSFTLDYRSIDFDEEVFNYTEDIDIYDLPWRFRVETQVDVLNFGLTYQF